MRDQPEEMNYQNYEKKSTSKTVQASWTNKLIQFVQKCSNIYKRAWIVNEECMSILCLFPSAKIKRIEVHYVSHVQLKLVLQLIIRCWLAFYTLLFLTIVNIKKKGNYNWNRESFFFGFDSLLKKHTRDLYCIFSIEIYEF